LQLAHNSPEGGKNGKTKIIGQDLREISEKKQKKDDDADNRQTRTSLL
jgi:hypothetical protein